MNFQYIRRTLAAGLSDRRGNFAVMAALGAPLLLAGIGTATDYAFFYNHASKLQDAADAAALATVRELSVAHSDEAHLQDVASSFVASSLASEGGNSYTSGSYKVKVVETANGAGVTVSIDYFWAPFFAHFIDKKVLPISASATAELAGDQSHCAIALDGEESASLSLTGNAVLDAKACAVQVNSTDRQALSVPGKSKVNARIICVSGGYEGGSSNFSDPPVTDCPQMPDPLTARTIANPVNCDFRDKYVVAGKASLVPGVYCGGLLVSAGANVTMAPGTYIFADGDFDIGGLSRVEGAGVSLHFARDSRLFVRNASEISLSASREGILAGVLVSSSPANDPSLLFEIQSRNAKDFTGLVYLPNNTLKVGDDADDNGVCDPGNDVVRKAGGAINVSVDVAIGSLLGLNINLGLGTGGVIDNTPGCRASIGQYSDWTAIVSRKLLVTSGVSLELNADYGNSPVPVPANSGAIGTPARLTH
jgi:hypothetical protein